MNSSARKVQTPLTAAAGESARHPPVHLPAGTGTVRAAAVPDAGAAGTAADGRSARWQSHRANRREDLIKTARRAIHTLGPAASMEEIAAAAGTSKSVFYRYFRDKAGLRQAVGEVALATMQEKVLAAARTAATPREGLSAMVSAYLQMAETSPNVYAFVTRGGAGDAAASPADPQGWGPLTDFFAAITAMLAQPMRDFLAETRTPERLADAVAYWPPAAIGMVRAAGELWLGTPPGPHKPTQEQMTEQLTGWLFNGIAHDGPTPRTAANHP